MPNRHHKDLYLNWINDPSSGVVAWRVVIPYRKNGERHVWRYAVSKARYGGTKAKLKRIAIELRNRKLFEFRCSGYELFQSKIYVANTSGTTGVRETIEVGRCGSRPVWEARWIAPNGKIRRRTFSKRLYGSAKARLLAIEARQQGLAESTDALLERLLNA